MGRRGGGGVVCGGLEVGEGLVVGGGLEVEVGLEEEEGGFGVVIVCLRGWCGLRGWREIGLDWIGVVGSGKEGERERV